ncbi:MAG: hypothetical protein JW702_08120 [Clostridiales bacterium]|nr:hypothetical protein [Clostridiales bacterium]
MDSHEHSVIKYLFNSGLSPCAIVKILSRASHTIRNELHNEKVTQINTIFPMLDNNL